MRLGILTAGALSLVLATGASANTLNFSAPIDQSSGGVVSGNGADVSATRTASISNGANDNTASASIKAQVSADQGLTTDPAAVADMTVTYDLPYTITRVVSNGPNATANVPIQTILFTISIAGDVAKDNSQTLGGLGQAIYQSGLISSLGGRFASVALDGTVSQTGGGGLASSAVTGTSSPTWTTTINSSGAAVGEISLLAQVPTDYRMWSDFAPPKALDYTAPWSVTQSLTDTLRISFRIRAESRASGSVSTTGGEAIACIGQTSPLGSFVLDNARCGGAGVSVTGTVTTGSTQNVAVPEPSTLLLIGVGLAGVAFAGRRKLS